MGRGVRGEIRAGYDLFCCNKWTDTQKDYDTR